PPAPPPLPTLPLHAALPIYGICYIPRDRFRSHSRIVARAEHDRYLISRECGKRLQPRLEEIHRFYPDARILLFFRRHDEWIASRSEEHTSELQSRENLVCRL